MTKLLFIDRDGTLILEPEDEQIDAFEKLVFYPEAISYLKKISQELDFELVMVTNQDGLGTESFPEADFWPVHNFILKTFENEKVVFKETLIDRTFPSDNAPTRKPKTGMLTTYLNGPYDLKNSWVIGDRLSDIELAKNLGSGGILLSINYAESFEKQNVAGVSLKPFLRLKTDSWKSVYEFLKLKNREVEVVRNTTETQISLRLNLDGNGAGHINTGIAFFDHMLEQVARHGGMDIELEVKGDLKVDEHHTIEDTALALGEAFYKALGNKLGVERYGFHLPMDDALATVALDFGGRSWLVWETEFKREMIGKMPTEMFSHFFKSFADAAGANLNIKATGQNEHHKIEAIFKAFARAIKAAVKRDPEKMWLPSTKGVL